VKSGSSKIAHTNDGWLTGISTASCIFFYDAAGSAMAVAPTFSLALAGRAGRPRQNRPMPMTRDDNLRRAHELLDWNRKNLRADTALTQALIAERFAPRFVVEANGRRHDADHDNYLAFLNGFRATIARIDYRVSHAVADEESVVLAMRARVERTAGAVDHFDAMLLLRFDALGKVVLWHEVYLPVADAS
jgi:hypothetical protein